MNDFSNPDFTQTVTQTTYMLTSHWSEPLRAHHFEKTYPDLAHHTSVQLELRER